AFPICLQLGPARHEFYRGNRRCWSGALWKALGFAGRSAAQRNSSWISLVVLKLEENNGCCATRGSTTGKHGDSPCRPRKVVQRSDLFSGVQIYRKRANRRAPSLRRTGTQCPRQVTDGPCSERLNSGDV